MCVCVRVCVSVRERDSQIASIPEVHIYNTMFINFAMIMTWMCTESVYYKTVLVHNSSKKVGNGTLIHKLRHFRHVYLFVQALVSENFSD